eukprot:3497840-Amphidinium_carterae.1
MKDVRISAPKALGKVPISDVPLLYTSWPMEVILPFCGVSNVDARLARLKGSTTSFTSSIRTAVCLRRKTHGGGTAGGSS